MSEKFAPEAVTRPRQDRLVRSQQRCLEYGCHNVFFRALSPLRRLLALAFFLVGQSGLEDDSACSLLGRLPDAFQEQFPTHHPSEPTQPTTHTPPTYLKAQNLTSFWKVDFRQ